MANKTIFMDDKHNIVPKAEAKWKVIHKYDKDGELEEEVWIDLKEVKE